MKQNSKLISLHFYIYRILIFFKSMFANRHHIFVLFPVFYHLGLLFVFIFIFCFTLVFALRDKEYEAAWVEKGGSSGTHWGGKGNMIKIDYIKELN